MKAAITARTMQQKRSEAESRGIRMLFGILNTLEKRVAELEKDKDEYQQFVADDIIHLRDEIEALSLKLEKDTSAFVQAVVRMADRNAKKEKKKAKPAPTPKREEMVAIAGVS